MPPSRGCSRSFIVAPGLVAAAAALWVLLLVASPWFVSRFPPSDARFRAAAERRLEQDVDRTIELVLRPFDVAGLEFDLACLEVTIRLCEQGDDRIFDRSNRGSG
jgi:hypothetical protein